MRRFPVTALLLALLATGFLLQSGIGIWTFMSATGAPVGEALLLVGMNVTPEVLIAAGAITPETLDRQEYWRFLTAPLLHAGLLHLALNVWALLQFATLFERLFGHWRLAIAIFLTTVAASMTSAIYLEAICSVGASGAVFGIVGALIPLTSGLRGARRWSAWMSAQIGVYGVLSIGAGFFQPGIDNAAHVGGFTAGAMLGVMFHLFARSPVQNRAAAAAEHRR
jgi:rhomboid protease GluP